MMDIKQESSCSSQYGRMMMEGVEEIIGLSGVNALMHMAGLTHQYEVQRARNQAVPLSHVELSIVQTALEQMYGPRGGRGVALRAGRACFNYLLRRHGQEMGLFNLEYRLLPSPNRIKQGLEALAQLLSTLGDSQISLREEEKRWVWSMEHCPLCWGRHTEEPVCHFIIGILQEFMAWASSGRVYSVVEVECQAINQSVCILNIEKAPLD